MQYADYIPDRWVLVDWGDGQHAIISGWSGSYLYGSSWRRSSPISKVEKTEDGTFMVKTGSSVYQLNPGQIGYTVMSMGIAQTMREKDVAIVDDEATVISILEGKMINVSE